MGVDHLPEHDAVRSGFRYTSILSTIHLRWGIFNLDNPENAMFIVG